MTYLLGGTLGLVAAVALTLEKLATLADPDHVPSCSLNPVISCGTVMASPQASAFGFPNPLLGIAGFAVVSTVGVVLLAGARLPRWFQWGLQAGTTFGAGFVHWLIGASLYDIHALCPYCLAVWIAVVPLFVLTTVETLRRHDRTRRAAAALARVDVALVVAWYVVIAALVLQAFWDYWITLVH
ncbi:vitamin K epoxide reductase family protein [Prauserella sp. ASG 168]|uniref:Vitamin K epoxide reductase family protein n=1 Tax=Prauserella cavernicola TaxID=2800127 RepID=A0A934QWE5_9PSEU|nr:vitamin K epoxide reductase family protein [Prauserella cavernicola]